jgi:predicted MFS family arabinose efflux permease
MPNSSSVSEYDPNDARAERRWLFLLTAMSFTNIVDFMVMMPLASFLMREFRITTAQFSVLVSAYAVAAAVSSLVMASIADRFDRKRALMVAYGGMIVGTIGCALAPTYFTLLLARLVAGLFGGVMSSIIFAMVGDRVPDARRGRAMGLVMMGFSFSAVIGIPLSIYIAAQTSWRVPFAVLSVACIALYIVAEKLIPSMRGHIRESRQKGVLRGYIELVKAPNHAWAMVMTALIVLSGMIVIPFIAPTRIANEGMTEQQLALFYIAGGAVTLFTRPLFGGMSDRYHRPNVFYWLVLCSAVPILLVTHRLGSALWLQIAISVLFFIFVSGRFIPLTAMVTAATTSDTRGRLMSLNSAVQNFALGFASLLGGAMLTTHPDGHISGYEAVGYLSVLFGLASVWASYKVRRVS